MENKKHKIEGNVLVLSMDEEEVGLMKKILDSMGVDYVFETSIEKAIKLCESTAFDIIAVDVHISNIFDSKFFSTVRQIDKTEDAFIVAIAHEEDHGLVVESYKCGVDDYIKKPIKQVHFKVKLESQLARIEKKRKALQQILFDLSKTQNALASASKKLEEFNNAPKITSAGNSKNYEEMITHAEAEIEKLSKRLQERSNKVKPKFDEKVKNEHLSIKEEKAKKTKTDLDKYKEVLSSNFAKIEQNFTEYLNKIPEFVGEIESGLVSKDNTIKSHLKKISDFSDKIMIELKKIKNEFLEKQKTKDGTILPSKILEDPQNEEFKTILADGHLRFEEVNALLNEIKKNFRDYLNKSKEDLVKIEKDFKDSYGNYTRAAEEFKNFEEEAIKEKLDISTVSFEELKIELVDKETVIEALREKLRIIENKMIILKQSDKD